MQIVFSIRIASFLPVDTHAPEGNKPGYTNKKKENHLVKSECYHKLSVGSRNPREVAIVPLLAKIPTCRLNICNVQIRVMQTRATNFNSLPSISVFGLKAVTIYSANTRQFGAVFPTIINKQAKMQATRYFGLV